MSNRDVVFQVDIQSVVVTAEELSELTQFLRNKKFMFKDYQGKGNGFAGGEYEFSLVDCGDKNRIEIKPINETLWLYLNTFGKETECKS
jgi:hypothetical protein